MEGVTASKYQHGGHTNKISAKLKIWGPLTKLKNKGQTGAKIWRAIPDLRDKNE